MKKLSGSVYVILAGIFWGTMSIFVKALSKYGFSPLQITAIRFTFGVLFLALFVLVKNKDYFKIKIKDILIFIVMGVVSCFCMSYFYFMGITMIPVSVASVLLYTAPIWVLIASVVFFKEKLTVVKVIALAIAIIGCVLVSGFSADGVNLTGVIFSLLSSFAYASYSIIGKIATKKYHPFTVTIYAYFFAMICSLIVCNVPEMSSIIYTAFDFKLLFLMVGLGIISISVPFTLYTIGLSKVTAGKAAIMSLTEPMTTAIIGIVVFGETIGFLGLSGILAIVTAIVLINVKWRTYKK